MEHHPEHFGQANVAAIMEKVRCALKNRMVELVGFCVADCHDLEYKRDVFVTFESLKEALIGAIGSLISDHEMEHFHHINPTNQSFMPDLNLPLNLPSATEKNNDTIGRSG
ncbi:uncharacterized protein LOC108134843 [Drosophila elegans]|uniref:uncharacterized protein LOC108134843 n=1 Tax=Drosophila elegans TaxID=30023 RepID=UPI0007E6C557|nr:uncharacterized protein LOC108134843 [Drosophila elegans]